MAIARILLVTHLSDERAMYGDWRRAEGFDVRIADGPHHALATAIQDSPDIVVTRILQPGRTLNGIELLRRLKQDPATAHVPVVIIASFIQPAYRTAAMDAGCGGYLLLPVLPDRLAAELPRVLQERQRRIA